jgi:hypothetical protein
VVCRRSSKQLAVDAYRAAVDLFEVVDAAQQGGLAGAGGSQHDEENEDETYLLLNGWALWLAA